ncbi:hypothetical protein M3193_12645 [Sporosarcina luteola]|uniref:hypothetical protein n=1 Tax=Sporosarcina luteola TaxID=582850 RepID=UPI0020424CF7|nr:hypothetical protein [Sporosarcina luteola]MCM3744991.1 hypothetical protein [Sporosarcina luteola]
MGKIEVKNLVPKFLSFYEEAKSSDADERWALWEEHYNFAAVPPGDEGRKMARALVEGAWDQYGEAIPALQSWKPDEQRIEEVLQKVKANLGYEDAVSISVVYFVGAFDENPFVAPIGDSRLALCIPVETGASDIVLAHELTHIIHAKTADLSVAWERSIASTILQEGLAMRVSQAIVPGHADEDYTEHKKGWLKEAKEKEIKILQGILPHVNDSSSEVVMKYTFGLGEAGLEREVYYAGWVLVDSLMKKGVSFKEIASVPEEDMPEFVRGKIEHLLVTN